MDLKKNVKTYLYVKKYQLFEKNTVFPITMQESRYSKSKIEFKNVFLRVFRHTEKKYGRCSNTTTNNTQDTIRTILIYLMQPYNTSNSYILFSTAVLSPE